MSDAPTYKWYAGSDHAGFELKQELVAILRGLGDEVVDLGTGGEESVDYPDFGAAVGRRVVAEEGARGLIVCGTGIGIAIAANKVGGVRAAVVTCGFTARAAREHNDANVIALGQRVSGSGVAADALQVFRDAAFAGGRHLRRIAKIDEIAQIGKARKAGKAPADEDTADEDTADEDAADEDTADEDAADPSARG